MSISSGFQIALERLNPAQREAADTVEGPVLIVAGPGTGKTQTVSLRLANILKKTQAKPHNLLALTFTEAGAVALKERLASIIGAEAYGITATTFHSFCQRLSGLFPEEFASYRERTPLDSLGSFKLLREVLAAGSYPELAPAKNADGAVPDISSALSTLKREGITAEKLGELIGQDQIELDGMERINPRTKKPFGKVIDLEKKIAKNRELTRIYTAYQKLLAERELSDFDDLILDVVAKLQDTDHPFLLAYLQENYLYVTVDEYQDTNGAQDAILRAWASYDDSPNLCVVGDDDQSIYRFQGASLANILEFRTNYPKAKIVSLTTNYRSTQTILDASHAVIEQNKERLVHEVDGLVKDLVAHAPLEKGDRSEGAEGFPRALTFETAEDEAAGIVQEIQKLLAAKVDPAEIAVLYRKKRHADVLAQYLERAGVPHIRLDGRDALKNKRVQQLIALLRALAKPNDSEALLAIIFADYSSILPVDAYRLARAADRQHGFLDVLTDQALLAELGTKTDRHPEIIFSDLPGLKAFSERLMSWIAASQDMSLTELTETISAESGLAQLIIANEEYESGEAIATFIDFLRQFEAARIDPTTDELLADLKLMAQQHIAMKLPNRGEAAVQLLTAHGSKGLEWGHVFIMHATDNDWGGRRRGERIKLPELVPSTAAHEYIEDERRLFFVGMTRARQQLTITHAACYEGRELAPSRFLAEAGATMSAEQIEIPASAKLPLVVPVELHPELDPESRRFLGSLVEYLRMSPSALNSYLACPRSFLFQNLLRVPASADPADRAGAIFGTAVHAAFEAYFQQLKSTGTQPDIAIAIAALEIQLRREPLTVAQRTAFLRDTTRAVKEYIAFHGQRVQPPAENEYSFSRHDVRLGDIPLTGAVDRIDLLPGSEHDVRLIDYKTSPVSTRNAILGLTANASGDMYRQLTFYKMLSQLDQRFIFNVKEVVISFVRPAKNGDFVDESFSPSTEEIETLKTHIQETHQNIKDLKFDCLDESGSCDRCRSLKG